jgi:hypothetical protein
MDGMSNIDKAQQNLKACNYDLCVFSQPHSLALLVQRNSMQKLGNYVYR